MPKGIVYSGIVYLPDHPDADMHGLIRVCIREAGMWSVHAKLEKFGISAPIQAWNAKIWQESRSAAERTATERHYGELLACSLEVQYLSAINYRPIPAKFLRPPAPRSLADVPPITGLPPKEWQ